MNLQLPMDSEAEFQIQPSSSGEALEQSPGNYSLLAGAKSSGQRPTSQDCDVDQRFST